METLQPGISQLSGTIKKAPAAGPDAAGAAAVPVPGHANAARPAQFEHLQKDFIADMTHELRSPLASIKAALDIMNSDGPKPGELSRNMLNTAIRNTERLNSIITDIQDLSQFQSGKLLFHPERISAAAVAGEAAEAMRAWANSKGVLLAAGTEPGTPDVYADKRRTVQVLINLISNAIKFTPQGGSITVSAGPGGGAAAGFAFFAVKDTGCGIKPEDRERIFEKYVQAAAGERVCGTGLGLAITKAMVLMQGGKISLESEPGRGSTFRVGMPVYTGAEVYGDRKGL